MKDSHGQVALEHEPDLSKGNDQRAGLEAQRQ